MHLPAFELEDVLVAISPSRGDIGRVVRLRQNLSSGSWDEQIPGLLFKQSYAMLRWLESMPDSTFRGKSTLELGAGLGLLSVYVAARGGLVTATDGSERALLAAQENARANLPAHVSWNRLTLRLVRWQDVQSVEEARAAGLAPPYALVLCSALLYAPAHLVRKLVRLLWAITDDRSEILWGSGIVAAGELEERWAFVERCFEVVETVDAVAAGFTRIEGTTVMRLRRRTGIAIGAC